MNRLWKVTKLEFKITAANKAFVIITIIGPFLIFAISVLPGLISMNSGIPESTSIAVVGAPRALVSQLQEGARKQGFSVQVGTDLTALESRVLNGDLSGVLVVPPDYLSARNYQYYSRTGTDIVGTSTLNSIVNSLVVSERLSGAGIDPQLAQSLSDKVEFSVNKIAAGGKTSAGGFGEVLFTALGFVMLLYMTVLLYGQMIGRAVVAEKTAKTVEIMLSSVRPVELLFGKILGRGIAGLLQYAVWIGVAVVLIEIVGPGVHISPPPGLTVANLGYLVLFFVLAFFLYSAAYGALGAGAEDEQHMTQLAWPLLIFLIVPLVMISPLIMNPSSGLAVFLSFFPLTSPIVMLVRILVEYPSPWEIALSVLILAGTVVLFVFLAAKIFRVGILMTGKRPSFAEVIRWARVK